MKDYSNIQRALAWNQRAIPGAVGMIVGGFGSVLAASHENGRPNSGSALLLLFAVVSAVWFAVCARKVVKYRDA